MSGVTSGRSGWRCAAAILSAALLLAPGVAYLVGAEGRPIENRRQSGPPTLGWDTLDELGSYVADRMPLRQEAVRADGWIDSHVFGEDPAFGGGSSPRVVRGDDGYLFLADAIDNACAPHAPPEKTVAGLARFASIIAASGREIVTMVAPDKSTVHPDRLPEGMAKMDCFSRYTDRLWTRLGSAGIDGYVDLRAALQGEVRGTREPLYLRSDSHWDNAGSLVAVQAAVERFRPGLWRDTEVRYEGLYGYRGDLMGLLGLSRSDQAPRYAVRRPDVRSVSVTTIDDLEGAANRRFRNRAPSGRLIEGRSLLLLDSYGLVALDQIVPFFENLTVVRLVDFESGRFTDLIDAADRVWFLSVERSMSYRVENEVGSTRFLEALADHLDAGSTR